VVYAWIKSEFTSASFAFFLPRSCIAFELRPMLVLRSFALPIASLRLSIYLVYLSLLRLLHITLLHFSLSRNPITTQFEAPTYICARSLDSFRFTTLHFSVVAIFHSSDGGINYAGGKSPPRMHNECTRVRFARKWRPRWHHEACIFCAFLTFLAIHTDIIKTCIQTSNTIQKKTTQSHRFMHIFFKFNYNFRFLFHFLID